MTGARLDRAAVKVVTFGTGLLRTTVSPADDGGSVWRRVCGPRCPQPFSSVSSHLRRELASLGESPGTRLLIGEELVDGSRVYRPGRDRSVAHQFLFAEPEALALESVFRGYGALLAAVHQLPCPGDVRRPARGLVRLRHWLAGDAPLPDAAEAAEVVSARLGQDRWTVLREWCEQALDPPDPVLAHGAPGLGSLVLDPGSSTAGLLTGEDVCRAPWQFDIGWVLGELIEFRWRLPSGAGDGPAWQRLADALFEGYGCDLGKAWNRWAALRIALHQHDFAAYVGVHRRELNLYAGLLGRLIEQ
ncbi:hypothetical protein [Streptomyces sioyaensis]|uniref:hypothetical protein n=1 Tax=Streptomyces sioyaensis TaxID=67364 RepID=UPI003D735822